MPDNQRVVLCLALHIKLWVNIKIHDNSIVDSDLFFYHIL